MDDLTEFLFGKALAALNAREAERTAQDRAVLLALQEAASATDGVVR